MTETWQRRRVRAAKLKGAHPPANDLLGFYLSLLEQQESVFRSAERWVTGGETSGTHVPIDLGRWVARPQRKVFRRFVRDTGEVATPLLAAVARRIGETGAPLDTLLDRFAQGGSLDELAEQLQCDPVALAFFPRAFLQPVAEVARARLRGRDTPESSPRTPARCPWCGWPPQLAVLVDEAEVRGRRLLVCALCGGEWSFSRSTCPGCGETAADQLPHHVADSWPHLRVEECRSCRTYLKAVDVRADGLAVPVVDEIASVELDVWASERDLEKIQRNLLGL